MYTRTLAGMAALGMLAGGYGHARRQDTPYDSEPPPEDRYVAADWGAKPATSITGADLQRIADADAKRARKAARRIQLAAKGG